MEKLPVKKQHLIIKQYIDGHSYRDIAEKTGVSAGTVSNIINDLKAGRYPETGDLSGQCDILRETATELRKVGLAPGDALVGITVMNRLVELEIAPADIPRFAALCQNLATEEVDAPTLVRAALDFRDAVQRTGLSPEELITNVKTLEEQVSRLKPLAQEVKELEKYLKELTSEQDALSRRIADLKEKEKSLNESIRNKEKRESELSKKTLDLENLAQAEDERLATARKELKKLAAIGMSMDELSGFVERLKGIAHRHTISPDELYRRLLKELEKLDKGLGLETLIQNKQNELKDVEKSIVDAKTQVKNLEKRNQQLQEELSLTKQRIDDEKESVATAVKAVVATCDVSIKRITDSIQSCIHQGIDDVNKLRAEATEVGIELGEFRGMIDSNSLLKSLFALINGTEKVEAAQVRMLGLAAFRSVLLWVEANSREVPYASLLTSSLERSISQLNEWDTNKKSLNTGSLSS